MCQIIVSDVGRMIKGSSSSAGGAGRSPPSPSLARRWCVTTAHSLAKPSTCSASFDKKLRGMRSGKYAFSAPVALIRASSASRRRSQTAMPQGLMTMQPLTGDASTRSAPRITSEYHWLKSSAADVIESDACVAAPLATFCCFFCCCGFFFFCCCSCAAAQSGARARNARGAGRRKARAPATSSIATARRGINLGLRRSRVDGDAFKRSLTTPAY
mmetsp:Transcript_13168/g.39337  ORF Transcript_13168/g.39337 Transcript_13168/m.39337 type:complete len:215 (+) Transcript_13168:1131-1775(+)